MATKRISEKKVVMSTSAGAAPARRKSAPPQRATRTASAVGSSAPHVVSVESMVEFTNEAVAKLAYSYWVARNCEGGSPEADWLRAEQQLRAAVSSK